MWHARQVGRSSITHIPQIWTKPGRKINLAKNSPPKKESPKNLERIKKAAIIIVD